MKLNSILFSLRMAALCITPTFALADEFEKYPAAPSAAVDDQNCKELDFNSNFRAERSKANIISSNPERIRPNFAGKYLLLKNELMLETEWLIADCTTGKFSKERLYGRPEFKPNSSLAIVRPDESKNKNNDEPEALPELKIWKDGKWENVNMSAPVSSVTTPISPETKLQQYETLFVKFPATPENTLCKPLDYHSFFKVQNSKSSIERANPDRSKPNFAGKYLLLKNELLLETVWLVADCATGRFFQETFTSDHANFKADSLLVIFKSSSTPRLRYWVDNQWKNIPDPLSTKPSKVKNILYGADANMLIAILPNPARKKILTFEKLICTNTSCTVVDEKNKMHTILTEKTAQALQIVNKWGAKQSIHSGRCNAEKTPATCMTEISEETQL